MKVYMGRGASKYNDVEEMNFCLNLELNCGRPAHRTELLW